MDEYYKILGVKPDADVEEIEKAYQDLKAKYSKDRFLEGEAGNLAAKNLTKLEEAYEEVMDMRKTSSKESQNSAYGTYEDVMNAIKNGDLNHAQDLLDGMSNREAEWHYLESVIFYKKNWMNESKRQLEIAMDMAPSNEKYKQAYEKLVNKMNFASSQFHSGNANYANPNAYEQEQRQMGGGGCMDMCATYCCIEFMCHMCCR